MTQIEHRVELDAWGMNPDYSGEVLDDDAIARGEHRDFVGRDWNGHGQRQLEFLKEHGLEPHHRLMDVGCGSFRAGRHFIDYLEPNNYYGVEANHSVVQAGYDVELNDEQRAKAPVENFRANDRFDVDFGVQYDFAIANSVFTHVSLNHLRLCLYRLDKVMAPGGSFYATFFVRPKDYPLDGVRSTKKGKGFFSEKNVYWYYRSDIKWGAQYGDWKYEFIGAWGHPVGQKMARYTKMTADEIAARDAKATAPAPAAPAAPAAPPGLLRRIKRKLI